MLGLYVTEHHDTIALDDLKAADISHATCENIGITLEPKEPAAEEIAIDTRAALDEYLANFIPPEKGKGCVACGQQQGGLFGVFTWGICHGEGNCGHCGYPARGHHTIKKGDEEVATIENMVLQYHPSVLENNRPVEPVCSAPIEGDPAGLVPGG